MLLRSCIFARLLSSTSAASPFSPLHHLISTAAAAVPPNPSFAVQEYLFETCGLTRAQALKASAKLSHIKSPTNPDAVLSFLAGLGLSSADVAAVVAKDPEFLCARVDKTLASNVSALAGLGLSTSEVARLVSFAPDRFRRRIVVSKLHYLMHIFGSMENLLRALKFNNGLLTYKLERNMKPNVAILQECGLRACDIAQLGIAIPRMLTTNFERLQAMVALAEGLGVPRGSGMFRQALQAVAFLDEEKIAIKLEYLKKTFRWSEVEVRIAVSSAPVLLRKSQKSLECTSEFLFSQVGLEPAYIARRPVMVSYSLEGRIRPRYYVLKFLKEKRLLNQDRDYYSTLTIGEKVFMEKFICPHGEAAPHLAEDYAASCRGEVPTRFRFT